MFSLLVIAVRNETETGTHQFLSGHLSSAAMAIRTDETEVCWENLSLTVTIKRCLLHCCKANEDNADVYKRTQEIN